MAFQKSARIFVSEFLCTSLLVGLTCLACSTLESSIVPLSTAYGLIVLVLVHCFRPISGAYANPAVSLAMWFRGCMRLKRLLLYAVAEFSGGIAGHYVANKILGRSPSDTLCAFSAKGDSTDTSLMATEFFLTFLLILSWCVLWEYESELSMEWYLAAVSTLVSILGSYLTGATTNPARALAPAIFVEKPGRIQICIGSQLLAGIAAPLLWSYLDYWAAV